MQTKTLAALTSAAALLAATQAAAAPSAADRQLARPLPASVTALRLDAPRQLDGVSSERLHPRLASATGDRKSVV